LREFYRAQVAEILAEEAIFVDESAANERTKDRKRGWSPRGVPCRVTMPNGRSRRWSILPAIGINGYLDYEIYHGSFNSERFNNFIRRLLSKMNPYPGPRSVLIMDNCSAHHTLVSSPTPHSLSVLIIAFRSFERCVNRQAFD
jgi:DDE superfamily endonuclease